MSVDNIQRTTNGASLLPQTAAKRKAPEKRMKIKWQAKNSMMEISAGNAQEKSI